MSWIVSLGEWASNVVDGWFMQAFRHLSRSEKTALLLFFGALILTCAIFGVFPRQMVESEFPDDAFFYDIVARNIVAGVGSSADGISETNGYHPLLATLLIPLYSMSGNGLGPRLVFQSVIAAAALVLLFLYLRKYVSFVAAAALCILATATTDVFFLLFNGMESGLVLFFLLVCLHSLRRGRDTLSRILLGFGLVGLFLSRLDGGLFWVALAGVLTLAPGEGDESLFHRIAAIFRLFAVPACVAAGYMAFNVVRFGSPVPISGRIKMMPWGEVLHLTADHFYRFIGFILPGIVSKVLNFAAGFQLRSFSPAHVLVCLVTLAYVVAAVVLLRRKRCFDRSLMALATYVVLHMAYYVFLQRDTYCLGWVKVPETLFLYLCLLAVGDVLLARWARVWRGAEAVLLGLCLVVALAAHGYRMSTFGEIEDFSIRSSDFKAAVEYLHEHTESDAVLASHNIGFLGFFAQRNVASMDGLLNSPEYYLSYRLERRQLEWLEGRGIRWLVEAVPKGFSPIKGLQAKYPHLQQDMIERIEVFDSGRHTVENKYVIAELAF